MSSQEELIGYTGENALEEYISAHIEPEGDLLKSLYRETNIKLLNPRMASGHIQGRLLKSFNFQIIKKRERILKKIIVKLTGGENKYAKNISGSHSRICA